MADPDGQPRSDFRLESLAAALAQLDGDQLRVIRRKLLPERLRAINLDDSKLLQLPQELRDQVYDMVLEDERPAYEWLTKEPPTGRWSPEPRPVSLPPLFRVCRQLREEFAAKYWKELLVYPVMDLSVAAKCMAQMDPKHKKLIRRVNYDGHFDSRKLAKERAEHLELRFGLRRGVVWALYQDRGGNGRCSRGFILRVNSLGREEVLHLSERF